MSNSCNQTSTLSNTAEIVEIEKSFRTTPLLLNKERFLGLSKITKQKNRTFSKVLCLKNNYNQHTCK
jgi:hypothetical protein